MGAAEVEAFLSHLATVRKVSAPTQTQAIIVRSGKGNRDRVTILPAASVAALEVHLRRRRDQHLTHVAGLGATGTASPLDAWLMKPGAR
jgi:site-specific recombinase XerD